MTVTGDDGVPVTSHRFVVAVCTCRRSRSYPWCDTSHRRRIRSPAEAAGGARTGTGGEGDDRCDDSNGSADRDRGDDRDGSAHRDDRDDETGGDPR